MATSKILGGKWFNRRRPQPRIVVLSLDGVPYSLLQRRFKVSALPFMSSLFTSGSLLTINSVLPTVSSVAWASYMTGKNPAGHGIFGFIERKPATHEVYIPTGVNRIGETLWSILSNAGKRVAVINVPMTYPPGRVNGVIIAGFLCTRFEKLANPDTVLPLLKRHNYQIDVDTRLARTSKEQFVAALHEAMIARFAVAEELYADGSWDYFHLHIMETDRINHFLWDVMEDEPAGEGELFFSFYEKLDQLLAEFYQRLAKGTIVIMLSDHGFCRLRREVNLNVWLEQAGFLSYSGAKKSLTELAAPARCYSLIPGRIYAQLNNREFRGWIEAAELDGALGANLSRELLAIRDPLTDQAVVERVVNGSSIFQGPASSIAPDWIAVPARGYDLKSGFERTELFTQGDISGMHTFDDAFLWCNHELMIRPSTSIMDLMPTVLDFLRIPSPQVDGVSLLQE